MKVKSESEVAQSRPTPSDPMDCSPPGSSIHGIFQARVLEWVAIAFFGIRSTEYEMEKVNKLGKSKREDTQSYPTLSDLMDCSLPDSSIHGIFQARVLEWVAIAFSNLSMGRVELGLAYRTIQGTKNKMATIIREAQV